MKCRHKSNPMDILEFINIYIYTIISYWHSTNLSLSRAPSGTPRGAAIIMGGGGGGGGPGAPLDGGGGGAGPLPTPANKKNT